MNGEGSGLLSYGWHADINVVEKAKRPISRVNGIRISFSSSDEDQEDQNYLGIYDTPSNIFVIYDTPSYIPV